MKQHSLDSRAVRSAAVSRILCLREILFVGFGILLSESVCWFPGIVLR